MSRKCKNIFFLLWKNEDVLAFSAHKISQRMKRKYSEMNELIAEPNQIKEENIVMQNKVEEAQNNEGKESITPQFKKK